MAINKKLIHFKTKANFNAQLEAGNILDTSIVYIQDAKEIYTHGTTYGTCLSEEQIETIIANSDTIADVLAQIAELETSISTNLNTAKAYTDQKIADLVGQAPEALDTVYELASAMSDNQSAVDTLEQAIANKVDKVTGKGLSTNDYTTGEKNKLAGIAAGAQVNTITGVKGSAEAVYRTGNVEITKANIGLANVDNTADASKSVNYATSSGTATTATNLASAPTLAASGNNITVTAGGKTSAAFTVPYATSAGSATNATKATQDASGNTITTTYATKTEITNKQDKCIKFSNLSASNWVADTTYSDFGYKCNLSCSGVTANMYAEVVFDVLQASSGNYAPVCETGNNIVSIWSTVNDSITVPVIIITK